MGIYKLFIVNIIWQAQKVCHLITTNGKITKHFQSILLAITIQINLLVVKNA
jgi:hypothetical protein